MIDRKKAFTVTAPWPYGSGGRSRAMSAMTPTWPHRSIAPIRSEPPAEYGDGFCAYNICVLRSQTRRGRPSTWRRAYVHAWAAGLGVHCSDASEATVPQCKAKGPKPSMIALVSGTNYAHAMCPSIRCMLALSSPPRPDRGWELLDTLKDEINR